MKKRRAWLAYATFVVLGVSLGGLWIRSCVFRDVIAYTTSSRHEMSVTSYLGCVHFMHVRDCERDLGFDSESMRLSDQGRLQHWPDDPYIPAWNDQYPAPKQYAFLGFAYLHGWMNLNPEDNGKPPMVYRSVVLPYWFVLLILACGFSVIIYGCYRPRRTGSEPNTEHVSSAAQESGRLNS